MFTTKIFKSIHRDGYLVSTKKLSLKIFSIQLAGLRWFYKYNVWHNSLYAHRLYAQAIVTYLNNRSVRNTALEIGCGTGDILRRIDFGEKMGLDSEQEVLNALNFLKFIKNRGGKITTQKFNFLSDSIKGRFDVIILCNWIHEIEPPILKEKLTLLFEQHLNQGGELIIDTLENPSYAFNHDISTLTNRLNCTKKLLGKFEYGRKVYSIFKP